MARTLSRAAKAKMSEQETVWGHRDSSLDLALSMIWNPRSKGLPGLCRSMSKELVMPGIESRRMEPSQPCDFHNNISNNFIALYYFYRSKVTLNI